MKFSLILPVYNVEKYLEKCVISCLKQDLSQNDYEIIIVIDGSPDNSISIAKNLKKENSCIKIIEQENQGLSGARNTGLKYAQGEYIWFIDSDDYIEPNILSNIYIQLKQNNLDCLWIQWKNISEKGEIIPHYDQTINQISTKIYDGKGFMKNVLGIYLYAWSFIYKKDFLKSNSLVFTPKMFYEDSDFAFHCLPLVKRIQLYSHSCYYYLNRTNSIVNTLNSQKIKDICHNALTAFSLSQDSTELNTFYQRCYSSFILLALRGSILGKSQKDLLYLNKILIDNQITYLYPIGSRSMKILSYLFNKLGCNFIFKTISLYLNFFK